MVSKIPERVWTRWAPALGILGVMLCYALFLYRHAINIPYADDIFDILQLLINVVKSTDFTHTFKLLFAQHNEHRTLSSRLVYYLLLIVAGEINFRTLIFLANLAIPLMLLLFWLSIRHHRYALLILLPVALVLFQPRFYELSFWSMAGFAYMFVYLYAFASLSCLREVGLIRFLAAVVFASLGTFTLASGQLIWLVGFASLLHQALVVRRISLAYPVCWMCCAALILLAWRIGYETQNTMDFIWNGLLEQPRHYAAYFLVLLGNALSESSVALAVSAGGVMLIIAGYTSVRSIPRNDISLELYAGYIVLSIVVTTLGRASATSLEFALMSHYSLPSVLLLATTIAMLGSRLPASGQKMSVYAVAILLTAAYWVSSFQVHTVRLQQVLERTVKNYNQNTYWAFAKSTVETNAIVSEAIAMGIYKPPPRPYPMPDVAPAASPRPEVGVNVQDGPGAE